MKHSYKAAVLLWPTVVCVGLACNCGKGKSQKSKTQQEFETVWESKVKDSITEYAKTTLSLIAEEMGKTLPPQLKQDITNLYTQQINKYVQRVKACYLKLPDQELKRLVLELEKAQDVLQTLDRVAPEFVRNEIDQYANTSLYQLINNTENLIHKEYPEIYNTLQPYFKWCKEHVKVLLSGPMQTHTPHP